MDKLTAQTPIAAPNGWQPVVPHNLTTLLSAAPWCAADRWSPCVTDWLLDRGSLTTRLRQAPGALQVRCLQEASAANGGLRQVLLCKDDIPWVWGITCFDPAFLLRWPTLLQQGSQPLGDWLFTAGLSRSALRGADLAQEAAWQPFCQSLAWRGPLWARHCRWQDGEIGLHLYEIFLPAAPLYAV